MTFPGAGNRGRPGVTALPLPHPQHCRRPGGPGQKALRKGRGLGGPAADKAQPHSCTQGGPCQEEVPRPGRVGGMGFPGPTGLSRKLARALSIS